MIDTYVTPDEFATRLGVSRRRILEWNSSHKWPHTRIGKHVYWTEAQIAAIMRSHAVIGGKVQANDGRTSGSRARAAS